MSLASTICVITWCYTKNRWFNVHCTYAIVDEVDSILVDEARTPLIISGQAAKSTELYYTADRFVKRLTEEEDYTIDIKVRSVAID